MELFELEGICRFVADFVAFEPLPDLVQPPAYLASPASVLAWQVRAEHGGVHAHMRRGIFGCQAFRCCMQAHGM